MGLETRLREFVVLAEDLNSVSSINMAAYSHLQHQFQGFWHPFLTSAC